jgi:hypothetical protein
MATTESSIPTNVIIILHIILGDRRQEHEDIHYNGSILAIERSVIPGEDVDCGNTPGRFVHTSFARHACIQECDSG